jgi:hypothetical protein
MTKLCILGKGFRNKSVNYRNLQQCAYRLHSISSSYKAYSSFYDNGVDKIESALRMPQFLISNFTIDYEHQNTRDEVNMTVANGIRDPYYAVKRLLKNLSNSVYSRVLGVRLPGPSATG